MTGLKTAPATELMQRMMAREFHLIDSVPLAPFEAFPPVLKDHLLYPIGLEKAGVLFASGLRKAGPQVDDERRPDLHLA